MNYMNKLMGVSLIALAALSACTDETENGGRTLPGDRSLSFAVSTKGASSWKPANGTRAASASATQELAPIEMEGKLNGETVYLTAEVTDGFPGDNNRPMTRGTQITDTNKKTLMKTFGVSAYTDKDGKPDYMYNETAEVEDDGYWYPKGKYYWPTGKQLSFYAWYPTEADGMTFLTGDTDKGAPKISYTVPNDVAKQVDIMSAKVIEKEDPTNTTDGYATLDLTFEHALSAVKFVAGDLMPQKFTIQSIKIVGIKNKGSYTLGDTDWILDNGDDSTTDFTLSLNRDIDKSTSTAITADDETLFMLPQSLGDNSAIEVTFTYDTKTYTLQAALKGITDKWEMGKTYTYYITTKMISAEVTFFKGVNGRDGNPYTAHDISANGGEPFTIDYQYPVDDVTSLKARLAYELTDEDGNVTYEVFSDEYDLKGTTTTGSLNFSSPVMNNLGTKDKAKKDKTPFVVQINVTSSTALTMPSDPDDVGTEQKYIPATDDGTWYTIWRGTMFPPNYINCDSRCDFAYNVISREDGPNGTLWQVLAALSAYWEVNENHPRYGKGKWQITNPFWGYGPCHRGAWIYDMGKQNAYPGGDELYGEKMKYTGGDYGYWTSGLWGNQGSDQYYVINVSYKHFKLYYSGSDVFNDTHMFKKYSNQTSNCRFNIFSNTAPNQW